MADSALTPDPLERYGSIEQAYCEERWTAVIHDGQTLLSDLAQSVAAAPEGLKERLQLLIGHAYLYGLGDRDSAEDHYQAVLHSGAEASLRQIAEQGLQQCVLPVGPAEIEEEEDPAEPATGQAPEAGAVPSAWQEDPTWDGPAEPATAAASDGPSGPEPDVAPLPAVADGWGMVPATTSPEPIVALDWLSAGTPTAPQPGNLPQPVMPWLDSVDATAPTAPETFAAAQDPAASRELLQPEARSLPSQPAEPRPPLVAAPDQVGPAAPAGSDVEPALRPGDVEPLYSPETAASLAATAAAVAAALQRSETGLPPGSPSLAPQPAPELPAGSQPLKAEERLVADVIDEPELIELHQVGDRRREEILLEPADAHGLPLAEPEAPMSTGDPMNAPPEVVLPAGVQDRRGSDLDSGDSQEGLTGVAATQPSAESAEPAPAQAAAADAAAPPAQPVTGQGPFSAPPEPVAEEDPELLMGLLRVEMG